MKKLNIIIVCITLIFMLCDIQVCAEDIQVPKETTQYTLPEGYYDDITINAQKVYEKGFADGKANASVTTEINNIIVNSGNSGRFADGTSGTKTYTSDDLSNFSLEVQPVNSWFKLNGWKVTFPKNDLVFTPAWEQIKRQYTADGTFTIDLEGDYDIYCGGGVGNKGASGAGLTGTFHLGVGDTLYFYINKRPNGGNGGGYTAAYVKKSGSSTSYPLLVAGGGSSGFSTGGGYPGNGNKFDSYNTYWHRGSTWVGYASTALDQTSAYNPSLMGCNGSGINTGMHNNYGCDSTDIMYGGNGWRGGGNGNKGHVEGNSSAGYVGNNWIRVAPTAGSSHYITDVEMTSWGLTGVLVSAPSGIATSSTAYATLALRPS